MSIDRVPPGIDSPSTPETPETPETPPTPVRVSRWRRLVPVLALMALAPWTAECSWGGFTAVDALAVVVFLGPMYGGAALLIRETVRRTGGGWPAIALLAAAFGVVQAGLVDQSLFNPEFLADTEFADTQAAANATLVPGLGFSAQQAVNYIGNHVALSICAPIAIVESFLTPRRRREPWLGGWGLAVIGVVYLLGSLLVFSDDGGRKGFLASPVQLTFAVALALALIGAALLSRRRRGEQPLTGRKPAALPEDQPRRAPHPIWPALVAFGGYLGMNLVPGWIGVGLTVTVAVVATTAIVAWSRRTGWGQRHVLAGWAAGLVCAAAFAYAVPNYAPASPTEALIGDVAISVITLALVGGAFWRLRAER
ncbi:hypothetical protein AB0I37_24260 [Micromonospora purpureochromogenes]|uniref:hypothetical protein n=1 Tax=Micromonospora purpureochromogenes TaxID=47872 RepID=UPI0033CBE34B